MRLFVGLCAVLLFATACGAIEQASQDVASTSSTSSTFGGPEIIPPAEVEPDDEVLPQEPGLDTEAVGDLAMCPEENIDDHLIALVDFDQLQRNTIQLSAYAGIVLVGPVESSSGEALTTALGSIRGRNGSTKLFVDEEGGAVQRLANVIGDIPSAAEQAELTDADLSQLWAEHNQALVDLGFNGNFGPVVDVGTSSGIDSRSFSDDPEEVIRAASIFIEQAELAEVESVIKHFPGHGVVDVDTHESNATTPTLAELEETHIRPFADLVESESTQPIMVSHLIVGDDAESETLASISPTVYEYLDANFPEAPLYTDAFNMGAAINTGAIEMGLAGRALELGADFAIVSLAGIQECAQGGGGSLPVSFTQSAEN